MSDIVERLRFDATRCELQFSKGVAQNIEEGVAEIERLRATIKLIREPSDEMLRAGMNRTYPDNYYAMIEIAFGHQQSGEKK